MEEELKRNGVDIRIRCDAAIRSTRGGGRVASKSRSTGRTIKCDAVVSNANLRSRRSFGLVGEDKFDKRLHRRRPRRAAQQFQHAGLHGAGRRRPARRIRTWATCCSAAPRRYFRTEALLSATSPAARYSSTTRDAPAGRPRCLIVSSTNAHYDDWADLPEEEYEPSKQDLCRDDARCARQVRAEHSRADRSCRSFHAAHLPALHAPPVAGASFGTKFEGLAVSRALPQQVRRVCTTPAAWASS